MIKENKEGIWFGCRICACGGEYLRKEVEVVGKWSVKSGCDHAFFVHNHDWQNLQKNM